MIRPESDFIYERNSERFGYTQDELSRIAGFFRTPIQPRPVHSAYDIKEPNNQILLSYIISGKKIHRKELADLLGHPEKMYKALQNAVPAKVDLDSLPDLKQGRDYFWPMSEITGQLRVMHGDCFVCNWDDSLFIAKIKPQIYSFPDGDEYTYGLLTDEASANVHALLFGFGTMQGKAFLRKSFFDVMMALLESQKDDAYLAPHRDYLDGFEEAMKGICLSHELCEMKLVKEGYPSNEFMHYETLVEKVSRGFLEKKGVAREHYLLFHKLRAGPDEHDVSSQVLSSFNFKA